MKKVILVVAMVFATGSFVNANTSEVSETSEAMFNDCAEKAWAYADASSSKDKLAIMDAYYDGCMG
ncbi:hypothetical protein AUW17_00750 [Tenacibaculum dicentrarchi]|nr:hypothetical protein AUW17_00750 [Tenacibaculum dicentrarchi]